MRRPEFLAALFCLVASLGGAAEIEIAPPLSGAFVAPYTWDTMEGLTAQRHSLDFSRLIHIRLVGVIEPGDAQRMKALIAGKLPMGGIRDVNQQLVVSFDSPGGSYQEGLALSDLIQAWSAATYVGPGDECLSACALAWLGGRAEMMRDVMWQPTRFLHVDSSVGFHAPFNNEYPRNLASLDAAGIEFVADLFYALATESIREMQRRLTGWQIRPEFAFDLLGKGRDEFLFLDHADPLFRNQFTAVAEGSAALPQIGALEALAACNYVLRTAVEPATDYQEVRNRRGAGPDFSDPRQLAEFATAPLPVTIETTPDGRDALIVEDHIRGRGPFTCRVEDQASGWVISLSGELPRIQTAIGSVLDSGNASPFLVSEHNALGAMTPWRALKGDDLWLRSDPFADVPEAYQGGSAPSFDCEGDLDPAAKVICAFPILSRADAIMVALYGAKRDLTGVQEAQRAWLRQRNSACRVANITPAQGASFRFAGYCLLAFNLARIRELTGP